MHHQRPGEPSIGSNPENVIVIVDHHNKTVKTLDLSSSDGEHGYIVDAAAWTPDSKYFVFSVESSGGHQPWAFPTYVFSRKTCAFVDLEKTTVGATTTPEFKLTAPDWLITKDLSASGNFDTPVKVQLSKLLGYNNQ